MSAFFLEYGAQFQRASAPGKATVVASIRRDALAGLAPDPVLLAEGYELEISTREITLAARTGQGLYYGLQTLRQLVAAGGPIRCMRIEDWPGMAFRGVHLMLGCLMPTFERMKRIVEIMARHKLNAFVIEYDDRFRWEKYPFIANSQALTK